MTKPMEIRPMAVNSHVAAIAPASIAIKVVGRDKGFAVAEQKTQLLALKVLYDADGGVQAGDTLYLAGENTGAEWMKRKYSIDGGPEFVMVPFSSVFLVKSGAGTLAPGVSGTTDNRAPDEGVDYRPPSEG